MIIMNERNSNLTPPPPLTLSTNSHMWRGSQSYEGDWADGVMHGQGTYTFTDGCTYEGDYADGKRNGRGIYHFLDGSFFEGEYRDGVAEGRGTFTFVDGTAEVGRWEAGQPVGEATRFSPDHKTAWRLFDGRMTGPVSLDLADVIAQMAFRPKAARLARAVRDQLNAAHLEEERHPFPSPSSSPACTARSVGRNPRSPSPVGERPPWVGPLDVAMEKQSGGGNERPNGRQLSSTPPTGRSPLNSPGRSQIVAAGPPPGGYPTFAAFVTPAKASKWRNPIGTILSPKSRSPTSGSPTFSMV
jgi:hypothetical protein